MLAALFEDIEMVYDLKQNSPFTCAKLPKSASFSGGLQRSAEGNHLLGYSIPSDWYRYMDENQAPFVW